MVGETITWWRRSFSIVTMLALVFAMSGADWPLGAGIAHANISQGIGDVQPHQVTPNSTTAFQFSIYDNDSTNSIQWIKFDLPGGAFVDVSQASAAGWSVAIDPDGATFTGGSIDPGSTVVFQITSQALNSVGPPANWYTHISDQSDGSGSILTDGDLTVEVTNGPTPTISGILLTQITTTAVTVNWQTDIPADSAISYGDDTSYGHAKSNASLVTSHSLRLTGLTTNTGYHFQLSSTSSGGTALSDDNTFFTADAEAISDSGGIPAAGGGTVTQVGGGLITTPTGKPTETVPPTIALTSTLKGAYATAPVFTGTAGDNDAVAKVEYSTDGGKNWVRVDSVVAGSATTTTGKGKTKKTVTTTDTKSVSFSFTPVLTEDGNYMIMARVTDPSGNQARTAAQTLVIDRLPPRFGGDMVSFGAQVSRPDASGRWQAVVGVDQTITLGAVGGPIQVTVQATRLGSSQVAHSFTLRRNEGNGLWQGVMSFQSVGTYQLAVAAVDGAGNRTNQSLSAVNVLSPAKLTDGAGHAVTKGKVTLYYKPTTTSDWVVWDGSGFGQANPQTVKADGAFQLLVSAGTYYMKVESPGYETLVTRQFTLDRPTPLVPTLKLVARPKFKLGSLVVTLPWVSFSRTDISLAGTVGKAAQSNLVGKPFPDFSLPSTERGTTSEIGLLGKPTVVTVVSTWAPSTSEQLPALKKLQANGDLNVVPIVIGERMGRVQAFLGRSGYDGLNMIVDGDATLSQVLGVPSLPTHYILDRKGKVKAVLTGVVTADQLLKQLGG